ncbi:g4056 [Coccomyxa elongata]
MTDELLSLGALSASVEEYRAADEPEQEIFGDTSEVWERCTVQALFAASTDVDAVLAQWQTHSGSAVPLKYEVEEVPDQEWMDSVRASYQPARIGDGLWIVPTWCTPPEPSATNIILEPGLAFGTGEHPTTRLCLRALAQLPLGGTRVIDYGTGSGVLAIAALKMGASEAVGTDTDPLAVQSAACNAGLNGVAAGFRAVQCSASPSAPEPLAAAGLADVEGSFDVCVANILQGPLLELGPRLASYVTSGGKILLSGILVEQWPAVEDVYKPFFGDFEIVFEEKWALVLGTRIAFP